MHCLRRFWGFNAAAILRKETSRRSGPPTEAVQLAQEFT
jgi:hypothetical protein